MKTNTFKSDLEILIQFAKDQGWDEVDVMFAVQRLEMALSEGLKDYSQSADLSTEDT